MTNFISEIPAISMELAENGTLQSVLESITEPLGYFEKLPL
jgi:hypothetical protein